MCAKLLLVSIQGFIKKSETTNNLFIYSTIIFYFVNSLTFLKLELILILIIDSNKVDLKDCNKHLKSMRGKYENNYMKSVNDSDIEIINFYLYESYRKAIDLMLLY